MESICFTLEVCSGDDICLSVSYPLKELSALRPLYTFREMHFTTYFVHAIVYVFPPSLIKVRNTIKRLIYYPYYTLIEVDL